MFWESGKSKTPTMLSLFFGDPNKTTFSVELDFSCQDRSGPIASPTSIDLGSGWVLLKTGGELDLDLAGGSDPALHLKQTTPSPAGFCSQEVEAETHRSRREPGSEGTSRGSLRVDR